MTNSLFDWDGVPYQIDAWGRRKTFITMLHDYEREKFDILIGLMPDVDVVGKIMDESKEIIVLVSGAINDEDEYDDIDTYSHLRHLVDFCKIKYEMKHNRTDEMSLLYGCYLRDKDGCLCYDNEDVRDSLQYNRMSRINHSDLFLIYERMINRSYMYDCKNPNYKLKLRRLKNVTDRYVYMVKHIFEAEESFSIKYICNGCWYYFTYTRDEAECFMEDNDRKYELLVRDADEVNLCMV